MTDNIKLPPLPSGNVAHLIAAQAAEIEALRAERDALREALEDIRSRMRLDPFDRLAELDNIHQIADAALSKENSND